ncbi:MAG: FAM83 family protein [Candidatus Obscuribacterales bacterium]|nr:FAM83 family protein [Candidatus Obscuribacterales bacterium]
MSSKSKAIAALLLLALVFSGGFYAGLKYAEPQTIAGNGELVAVQEIETVFTPYQNGLGAYLNFLSKAKQSVLIACYGFTEADIVDKLIELKNKNVSVKLLLDRSQSAGPYQKVQIERLRKAGIEVVVGTSEKSGQIMHNKFTIVDGEWVEDGSWNYSNSADKQANTQNYVHSKKRAELFTEYWQRMYRFMSKQGQSH